MTHQQRKSLAGSPSSSMKETAADLMNAYIERRGLSRRAKQAVLDSLKRVLHHLLWD